MSVDSSIDVVRDMFGDLPGVDDAPLFTPEVLDELRGRLHEFYSASVVPLRPIDEFRTLFTGVWSEAALSLLPVELLYAHKTVVYDPLEGALSRAADQRASGVALAIGRLQQIAPLVDAGVVYLAPANRLADQNADEVAAFIYGATMHNGFGAAAVPDAIRNADSSSLTWAREYIDHHGLRTARRADSWGAIFATAAATDSQYVPATGDGRRVWQWALDRVARDWTSTKTDLIVLPSLFAADLPWLQPRDADHLLAIRRDEEAFAAWRAALRQCVRLLSESPASDAFGPDAHQLLRDALEPEVERIRRNTALRRVGSSVKQEAVTLTFGGAGIGGAAIAGALPLTGLAGLGIGAAARLIVRALLSPEYEGEIAVLAQLVRR